MLSRSLLALFTVSSLAGIGQLFDSPALAGQSSFYCDISGEVPVTKVKTDRGDETFITWKKSFANGYSKDKRCQIVTKRLQEQYNRGRFYLTTRDNIKGLPVICYTHDEGGDCNASNILVTLTKGEDAKAVVKQLKYFRASARSKSPIELSGREQAQIQTNMSAMTEVNGNSYVDVRALIGDRDESQSQNEGESFFK
jgi:hypothetical protein